VVFFIRILMIGAILPLLVGCLSPEQNIQVGNLSGKVSDNKWDYYNGIPVRYTSNGNTVYQDAVIVKNELTDAFSASLTVNDNKKIAFIVLNNKTIKLNKFDDKKTKDLWVNLFLEEGRQKDVYGQSRSDYYAWTDWYQDASGKYAVFLQRDKNIIFTAFKNSSKNLFTVSYYPSRYLACKKIVELMVASNQQQTAALLRTALVAGVQSYTSYSTFDYNDAYGNYGFGTIRDYSWAGDRAEDALTAVFNGNSDRASLDAAWSELNCW
jgi:hypothetical protein